MYTADPGPTGISIADPTLAMAVLVLGGFFIVLGTLIAGVVYRESREWRKMILPLFDREASDESPESSEGSNWMPPQKAAIGKEIFGRLFSHMDVAGLLGGGATVVLGVLVVLIGLTLNG